jgi:phage terminase large subunit-like protein
VEWPREAERSLLADAARRDLWTFIRLGFGLAYWPVRPGEEPLLTERIHKPLCDWFQKYALEWLANRKRTNLMVVVPRFFGKTTFITKAAQLWLHLYDPDMATYTGGESQTRAEEFLASITKIIDGSDPYAKFAWLYGNWFDKAREWRRSGVVHAARRAVARTEPSFGTWSVERGITGHHPDAGFLDDPTSYEAMANHANWFHLVNDHIASIMPVFGDNSLMVLIGTRYGEGDHLGTELDREGAMTWNGMAGPVDKDSRGRAITREGGKWHVYFLAAKDQDGTPIFPERCSQSFLDEFERKHNLRYYAQMMNDPAGSEYNPLTMDQINQCWVTDKDVPWSLTRRIVITMDTAFKSQERQARGDDSVMLVWGLPTGNQAGDVYYLEGHGSSIWRMEEFLDKLIVMIQKYRRHGRHIILTDEPEPGGKTGVWEYAIRTACHAKNMPAPPLVTLTRSRRNKDKIGRMVEAASYWTEGYVHILRDAPGVNQLIDQMAKIGNARHDDWADAAADIFNPKVYTPLKKVEGREPQAQTAMYAGDDVLKPTFDPIKEYDKYWGREEDVVPYEPV